jgi:hypothetical protein
MGIDFFEGKITPEHYRVPEDMRSEGLELMEIGEVCLTGPRCMWMDAEGLLWLDGKAPKIKIYEVNETDGWIYVTKLEEGYVVDISEARDAYTDPFDGRIRFSPDEFPFYAADGDSYSKLMVIGLVPSELESGMFQSMLFDIHGSRYPTINQSSQSE